MDKHNLYLAITALAIFMGGWQAGRVMSPYYAAHPITFNEAPGVPAPSPETDLIALREAGQAKTSPAVAGATTAVAPSTSGRFVGSVNSDRYHHLECPTWKQIKLENQIWFDSQEEAEAAGYTPTTCTLEKIKNNTK